VYTVFSDSKPLKSSTLHANGWKKGNIGSIGKSKRRLNEERKKHFLCEKGKSIPSHVDVRPDQEALKKKKRETQGGGGGQKSKKRMKGLGRSSMTQSFSRSFRSRGGKASSDREDLAQNREFRDEGHFEWGKKLQMAINRRRDASGTYSLCGRHQNAGRWSHRPRGRKDILVVKKECASLRVRGKQSYRFVGEGETTCNNRRPVAKSCYSGKISTTTDRSGVLLKDGGLNA